MPYRGVRDEQPPEGREPEPHRLILKPLPPLRVNAPIERGRVRALPKISLGACPALLRVQDVDPLLGGHGAADVVHGVTLRADNALDLVD